MSQRNVGKDFYRPSASVIIAAKTEIPEDDHNYKVLLFMRTLKTAVAPKHCVFPGGAMDISDESIKWLQYFKEFGISEGALQKLVVVSNNRAQLLAPQGTGCYDRFFKKSQIWARDISLRITALRETFEEVGVLLCRSRDNVSKVDRTVGKVQEEFDRKHWQQLVHDDASQFLELCKHLDVVPDLWCLQEWSAWRTAATASKKFETVYYFVALEEIPSLLPESSEVQLAMWHSPKTLLQKFDDAVVWLPFIIFYELARLTNVQDWKELFQFACERSLNYDTTLLMPCFYRCTDGMVAILPGDDNYPEDPCSLTETVSLNTSIENFRQGKKKLHRVVYRDLHDLRVDINISIDGHLPPIRLNRKRSKL